MKKRSRLTQAQMVLGRVDGGKAVVGAVIGIWLGVD